MYVGCVRLADHYIHVDDINIENKNRTRFKTETEKKNAHGKSRNNDILASGPAHLDRAKHKNNSCQQ